MSIECPNCGYNYERRGHDFNVNDYGIISATATPIEEDNDYSEMDYIFGGRKKSKPTCAYQGIPFKVLLINMPFMIVQWPSGIKLSLDMRDFKFIKSDEEYFRNFAEIVKEQTTNGYRKVFGSGW